MPEELRQYVGQRITIYAANYIYTGMLVSVGAFALRLTDCGVVYQTGAYMNKDGTPNTTWQDYQKMPHDWNVALNAVESFGILK